jgi:hypothetical protein
MAEALNYLRIAQILGGTLTETQSPSFGCVAALQTSAERFRLIRRDGEDNSIPREQFPLIAKAFEKIRDGYEPDRVIIDPALSREFIKECRRLGVNAPIASINRRLQSFRKTSLYGIKLKRTTRRSGLDPEPYFFAAELGYVQFSYRSRATIDDIITDPRVGELYVSLCKEIAPHGTSIIFKWAVLCLRKIRSFSTQKANNLLAVNVRDIERQLRPLGSLDRYSPSDVPKDGGIFSFFENNGTSKYLYVGSGDNLRDATAPFSNAKPFFAISGRFWNPSLSDISLSVGVLPARWQGASNRDWGLRLIQERHPLFNIPVDISAKTSTISS